MIGHKMKTPLLATVAACAMVMGIGIQSASAAGIEDSWNLNLTVANGVMHSGGGSFSGMTDLNFIDNAVLNGESIVTQTISGGVAVGNPFVDNGFLRIIGTNREAGAPLPAFFPTIFALGGAMGPSDLYFTFSGLTGTLNLNETITFDPNIGTIKLWLDSDTDADPTTGDVLELAEFDIVAPSGGSDLNFFGGGGQNATIDVTLMQISGLAGLFTDMNGVELMPGDIDVLHLGNFNALETGRTTVVDMFGNGFSDLEVDNAGQYNNRTIPEATSMAAFGFGLVGLMGMVSRRRRKAA